MGSTKKPVSDVEFKEHKRDVYFALIVLFILSVLGIIF